VRYTFTFRALSLSEHPAICTDHGRDFCSKKGRWSLLSPAISLKISRDLYLLPLFSSRSVRVASAATARRRRLLPRRRDPCGGDDANRRGSTNRGGAGSTLALRGAPEQAPRATELIDLNRPHAAKDCKPAQHVTSVTTATNRNYGPTNARTCIHCADWNTDRAEQTRLLTLT